MKKRKIGYFVLAATLLIIGWAIYSLTAEKVYIYNTTEDEQIDISDYYKTGLFYIYTKQENVTSQYLVRKHAPMFWDGKVVLKAIKEKKIRLFYLSEQIKNQEQILTDIVMTYPDFSTRMKYYVSDVDDRGILEDTFVGYFELDGQKYTLIIMDNPVHADRSYFDNISELTIDLINDYFEFPSSYENYLKQAKNQSQPQL